MEWQIVAVEVEEEGEWQTQNETQKKAIRVEKRMNPTKVDVMKAVVKQDGEVEQMLIGAIGAHAEENKMAMEFQVCGVKKALAAVHKICRVGNVVQFGSEEDECFIKNKKSGKKVMLRRKGGSYVMDVEFVQEVEGSMKTICVAEITVNSGAEESVCPVGWGAEFGTRVAEEWQKMRLVNAGGGVIPHVGSRRVTFKSSDF